MTEKNPKWFSVLCFWVWLFGVFFPSCMHTLVLQKNFQYLMLSSYESKIHNCVNLLWDFSKVILGLKEEVSYIEMWHTFWRERPSLLNSIINSEFYEHLWVFMHNIFRIPLYIIMRKNLLTALFFICCQEHLS